MQAMRVRGGEPSLALAMPNVSTAVRRRFAFGLQEGYAFITDPRCWPQYWPNLTHVTPGARWTQPGDVARLTMKLLGRPTELELTLSRIEPYRLVEYTSVQRGLPDARHERHFAEDRAGFSYTIVVEFEPRRGARRPLDRFVVARAIERAAIQTLDNLEQRFAELSARDNEGEGHDHH